MILNYKLFEGVNKDLEWIPAMIKVLKNNNNQPMTASEIWDGILELNLVQTKAKDPLNNNVYPLLQRHTLNIEDSRKGKSYFIADDSKPRKFKLNDSIKFSKEEFESSSEEDWVDKSPHTVTFAKELNKICNNELKFRFLLHYIALSGKKNFFYIHARSSSQIKMDIPLKKDIKDILDDNKIVNYPNPNYPSFITIPKIDIGILKENSKVFSDIYNILNSSSNKDFSEDTYIKYAVDFMKMAKIPLTAREIWEGIKDEKKTEGNTPKDSMSTILFSHSDNSTVSSKSKIPYFHIVDDTRPAKFWLIERLPELNQSQKSEIRLKKILSPADYFAKEEFPEAVENPFKQAICILGETGVGKSTRVEETLSRAGHRFDSIDPNIADTNLLVQFKYGHGYILGNVGKFILDANKDPQHCYTLIIDECHKEHTIEMINDELLQCISERRNRPTEFGNRFIRLNPEIDELFKDLPKLNGRRYIPDNIGFIFISSHKDIIEKNKDLKNRVDFVFLTEEDKKENLDFAIDFLKNKIEKSDERFTY